MVLLSLGLAVAGLGALPAISSAAPTATLSLSGGTVAYQAGAGEVNNLTVSFTGTDYRFEDAPGITIVPSGGCSATGNVGTCPATDVTDVRAFTNDMNDTVSADASITSPVHVWLDGQAGDDTVNGPPNAEAQLNGDDSGQVGNDTVVGGNKDDDLIGDEGNDTLTGGPGDDRLIPGAGNDTANAGPGDDNLSIFEPQTGNDGTDVLSGGDGRDFYDADSVQAGLTITLNDVADDGTGCPGAACENDNIHSDIEDIRSGQGNDTIVGTAAPNNIDAEGGNDNVDGGPGGDQIGGADGNDTLNGGAGPDQIFDFGGTDSFNGGPGDDLLFPAFADDGSDTMMGGGGYDTLDSSDECCSTVGIRVSLDGQPNDGINDPSSTAPKDNVMPDLENLLGTGGADILIGSSRPNELDGNGGADVLVGGKGADGLIGDRGNDTITGGKGADEIDGGGGSDRIRARDKRADDLRCGSAVDRVKADRVDRYGPDCDKVQVPPRRARA
jgi:Ca2+-binding RTX toxin-like protein